MPARRAAPVTCHVPPPIPLSAKEAASYADVLRLMSRSRGRRFDQADRIRLAFLVRSYAAIGPLTHIARDLAPPARDAAWTVLQRIQDSLDEVARAIERDHPFPPANRDDDED